MHRGPAQRADALPLAAWHPDEFFSRSPEAGPGALPAFSTSVWVHHQVIRYLEG